MMCCVTHIHYQRKTAQQLEHHIEGQNVEIMNLQARVAELEAQVAYPPQQDPLQLIEDLTTHDLTGRTLAWLRKCEVSARALADKAHSASSSIRRAVPDGFRCPITQDVMVDPVMVAETGHTYERSAIARWLAEHTTDPKTNVELVSKTLIPNHGLRATIEEFLANHGNT